MKLRANILPLVATVGLAIYAVLAEQKVLQPPLRPPSKEHLIAGKGVDISLASLAEGSARTQAKHLIARLEGKGVDIS